ncbi:MAG: ATP-binding protein [Chitinophagaceae bacterium]
METTAERKVISILIVDDDEDDFIIISEYIKSITDFNIYHMAWCPVYGDALLEIRKGYYDIYFIDLLLGAKTGLDLIKEAIAINYEMPLILLTGQGNRDVDIRAMQAGATDYLVKSELNAEKLERCIRYALSRQDFIKTIQANGQKFRSVFEHSQDCIFIAGAELVFTDVNQAGTLLFGYSREELLHLSLYDLLSDKNDQLLIENMLLTGKGLSDTPFELLTRDKEKINSILSISMESDGKGKVYAQGIIHDITSLKKSEQATRLTDKLKSAERLARVLAHEVRNPLNNIGLSSDQLHQEMSAEQREIYLDIITRNIKRIDDLISELLDSSRSSEVVLSKITLQSVLEESIAAAADRITLKFIQLQLDYPPEEAWIMADAAKLKIALLNIMINAVEAMNTQGGQLYIGIQVRHNNYVLFINDNGEGISRENLGRLFEPYYTSKRRGMGLGLGATANIIQSHNASIEVQSTLGTGTSFILTFKKENAEAGVVI